VDQSAYRRQSANQILRRALTKPPRHRARFVAEVCGFSLELRKEVEALLFVDTGILHPFEDSLRELTQEAAEPFQRGDRIGAYRLVEAIGQGGCGRVYLAQRADGQFERQVAIKVLKRGMDTDAIIRRFQIERQILADFDHPHIADLYGGGATPDHLPYLVMEYVDGRRIDEYCAQEELNLDARLRLILSVCSAVEYAHRHLVVHRDLKPSNILVKAGGEPKLLDFGIAKVLDGGPLADETLTAQGLRPLTPAYASPEQLAGEGATTACDIYSLGVLLYELLTGQRPQPAHGNGQATAHAERTELPSAVVLRPRDAGPDGDETLGAQLSAESLARRLHGDLDTIVTTAMHADPRRRYESVALLAADIRHHLSGLPIQARKPTWGYRAGKFIRRNPARLVAAVAIFLVLLAFATDRIRRQHQAAQERVRADKVASFLVGLFDFPTKEKLPGSSPLARQILDRGANRIASQLGNVPELRADLMMVIGRGYHSLGLHNSSAPLLEEALRLRRQQWGSSHQEVAESLGELARLRQSLGQPAAGESLLRQALAIHRQLYGEHHPKTLDSLEEVAMVVFDQGRYADAEVLLRALLSRKLGLLDEAEPSVARTEGNLGLALHHLERYDEAEPLLRSAWRKGVAALGEEDAMVTATMLNLAALLRAKRDFANAEPLYRQVLDRLLGEQPRDSLSIARAFNNLATLHFAQGDYAAAELSFLEAIQWQGRLPSTALSEAATMQLNLAACLRLQEKLAEAEKQARGGLALARQLSPGHPIFHYGQSQLGLVLLDQGKPAEAEPLLREALEGYRSQQGTLRTAAAERALGSCLVDQGRYEEAEPLLLAAHPVIQRRRGETHRLAILATQELVRLYDEWRRPEFAARYRGTPPPP